MKPAHHRCLRLGALALLFVAACGESPAYPEPEVPPPPPHEPIGAAPPGAAPDDAPPPAPSAAPTSAAPDAGNPLPPLPSQAPKYAPADGPPPPDSEWTVTYPTGRWVYADGYGWMWVPNDAGSVVVEEVPYVYLYTPRYGWTWYVSPWGYGPYHYGIWVRHPWHPYGWRYGWVARPHVVVRAGGHYHGGHHGRRH